MFWYVLYIKPKKEKKVAKDLENLGFNVYCPMITVKRQWSDRIKKVEIPLINSYIFIKIEEKQRNSVFQVMGVVRYLFYAGAPAKVRNKEIDILKEYLVGNIADSKVENLQRGDIYLINEGPFKGKKGIVKEIGKNRVQLLLTELGMKITLQKEE